MSDIVENVNSVEKFIDNEYWELQDGKRIYAKDVDYHISHNIRNLLSYLMRYAYEFI